MAASWTAHDIPDLTGQQAVVTGANSGLGLQTALALAEHGARVTLACRDEQRGSAALAKVRAVGDAELVLLDLADLASVQSFASAWSGPLDVLVNNAGVMAVPQSRTVDGFEMQLGTNHLGHFALTARLLPALQQATAGRVVSVSSVGHRMGTIDFDDLMWERRYNRWLAYGRSKLANLLFTRELARRLSRAGSTVLATAAHPGVAATELVTPFAKAFGPVAPVVKRASGLVAQSDAAGALPSLYAATMSDVGPDDYFGPDGLGEQRGAPTRVGRSARARDGATAVRLWDTSEQLTGVSFDLGSAA